MYICYECLVCKTVFIIPKIHVERMEKQNRYISCNFGHRQIRKLDKYDDLRECMDNHVYVKDGRRIRQIK